MNDPFTIIQILLICTPINAVCAAFHWFCGNKGLTWVGLAMTGLCVGLTIAIKHYM